MLSQKWGRIIYISSIAAGGTSINGCHYSASKAGLQGLSKNLANKLGKDGITCNDVAPAMITGTGMIPDEEALKGTPGDVRVLKDGMFHKTSMGLHLSLLGQRHTGGSQWEHGRVCERGHDAVQDRIYDWAEHFAIWRTEMKDIATARRTGSMFTRSAHRICPTPDSHVVHQYSCTQRSPAPVYFTMAKTKPSQISLSSVLGVFSVGMSVASTRVSFFTESISAVAFGSPSLSLSVNCLSTLST